MEELRHSHALQGYVGKAHHFVADGEGVELHAYRVLHPCVCHKNPPCADCCAQTSQPCGSQVPLLRQFLPAEEHQWQECGLKEECHDALDGKGRSEDVADKPRIVGPVCAKFKFQDEARSHTYGEVDTKKLLPELCRRFPKLVLFYHVQGFHNPHDEGEAKCEGNKKPVVARCQRKLRSRPVDERFQ